jgi:hypothetical protein
MLCHQKAKRTRNHTLTHYGCVRVVLCPPLDVMREAMTRLLAFCDRHRADRMSDGTCTLISESEEEYDQGQKRLEF